jgi:hypothetical protein
MLLIAALALIALSLVLAWLAGKPDHEQDRRNEQVAHQRYLAALAGSRARHPGGRDAA